MSDPSYDSLRKSCYEANLQLPLLNLVIFTFGNVSVADHSRKVFAIKPSGVPYSALSMEQMVVVDFNGTVVDGNARPSSDTLTHAVLYTHWQVNSIVHTHSLHATAWAQSLRDIPIYGTTHADHLTTAVPCAQPMKDEKISGQYEHETGHQIIRCFEERNLSYSDVEMILVGSHAPFTWGQTPEKAVYNSSILEYIAHMATLTEQNNNDITPLKSSLIQKHFERKHGPDAYYGQ